MCMVFIPLGQRREGLTGYTGSLSCTIIPAMSFAIGIFDKRGKDILLGVDRRWVDGDVGNYTIRTDCGTKSIALNKRTALAFTGHAEVIAKIVSRLYNDKTLEQEGIDVLKELEQSRARLSKPSIEIEKRLNSIIPDVWREYNEYCDLSVIMAGRISRKPVIVWWAAESDWKGKRNWYGEEASIQTFPKEVVRGSPIYNEAEGMFKNFGWSPRDRIIRTLNFLAAQPSIQSVSNSCIIRRLSRGFRKEEAEGVQPSN